MLGVGFGTVANGREGPALDLDILLQPNESVRSEDKKTEERFEFVVNGGRKQIWFNQTTQSARLVGRP